MLSAPLTRTHAALPTEHRAQILRVFKPRRRRNLSDRQTRAHQQFLHPLDPQFPQMRMRRRAQGRLESSLQCGPGHRHCAQDIPHIRPARRLLPHEAHRPGNLRVIDRREIGRLPRRHTLWRHLVQDHRDPLPGHRPCQQYRRFITGPLRIRNHARQRRIAQLAQQLVVVHADHRHLLRHREARQTTRRQYLLPAQIEASQHTDRTRQRF